MFTHDARRITHDDGPQPIAVGHLSDSGDLLLWVGVSCRPLCVMHHVLKSSQELLGQF